LLILVPLDFTRDFFPLNPADAIAVNRLGLGRFPTAEALMADTKPFSGFY
jgi:hypothetical protein